MPKNYILRPTYKGRIPQVLFGSFVIPFVPGIDPNWWQRFQVKGNNPAVVLDFVNGLYWNGTQTLMDSSSLVIGSPTITPGSGLLCNSNSIESSGALLSAFQGGIFTVQSSVFGGNNTPGGIVTSSVDGVNQLDQYLVEEGGGPLGFYEHSADVTLQTGAGDFAGTCWGAASTNTGTARTLSGVLYDDGNSNQVVLSDGHFFSANPPHVFLGCLTLQFPTFLFGGFMRELAVIHGYASPTTFLVPPPAFVGTNGFWWNLDNTAGINYGNILNYEYTQPWTIIAAILPISYKTTGIGITVFTNVKNSPFPGYELFTGGSTPDKGGNTGALRVRIIHDYTTSTMVDVSGTTNLHDVNNANRWHVVAATYDGSGTAAGVKIYLDGQLEVMETVFDALGGNSIIGAAGNNNYVMFNQFSGTFACDGGGMFRQYVGVKSQAFIQQFQMNMKLPPIDGSCVLAPALNEGGSNLTTADQSNSGFVGTLSSAGSWLRG